MIGDMLTCFLQPVIVPNRYAFGIEVNRLTGL